MPKPQFTINRDTDIPIDLNDSLAPYPSRKSSLRSTSKSRLDLVKLRLIAHMQALVSWYIEKNQLTKEN